MTLAQGQIFIQNPHHSYGKDFVRIFARKYGLKAVCNYTDPRDVQVWLPRFPSLLTDDVHANLLAPADRLQSLITLLRTDYNITAAIPHNEIVLESTIRINEALGLDWVPVATMKRFRNKESLKDHVRQVDPSLGISPSVIVENCQDIRDAMDRYGFSKVVLKPNDGWGNVGVGFFSAESSDNQIGAFLDHVGSHELLLEEFFGGREFYSCGQVDADGGVTTFAVFETIKGEANGRSNIDFEVRLIRRSDPAFEVLTTFTNGVVRASGLTRSPFHVDLKLDDGVPKLLEMGARMVGDSRAYDLNHVHGGKLDVFDLSAHYYLTNESYGEIPLDWDRYDSLAFRSVQGINYERQRLYSLAGSSIVEALPQFVRWAHEPEIGDMLEVTEDLLSTPWQITIEGKTEAELDQVSGRIRRLLQINGVANSVKRSVLKARSMVPRAHRFIQLRRKAVHLIEVPPDQPLGVTSEASLDNKEVEA